MDIEPATIAQIQRGKLGAMVEITDDVGGIAARLREIDPGLHLRYSERGEYFVVYHRTEKVDGFKDDLVTTSNTCDGRLLQRIERIASGEYDFVAEMERLDAERDDDQDHRTHERVGEIGERLAHAMRKDMNAARISIRVPA